MLLDCKHRLVDDNCVGVIRGKPICTKCVCVCVCGWKGVEEVPLIKGSHRLKMKSGYFTKAVLFLFASNVFLICTQRECQVGGGQMRDVSMNVHCHKSVSVLI